MERFPLARIYRLAAGLAPLLGALITAFAAPAGTAAAQTLVAERGESEDAPENTLSAFRLAWERGADAVFADLRLSSDGEPVLIRDATTRRTTGGPDLEVAATPLARLRELDVGWWKGSRFQLEPIPTLRELFASLPPGKTLFLELHDGVGALPALKRELTRTKIEPAQLRILTADEKLVETITDRWRDLPVMLRVTVALDAASRTAVPAAPAVVENARRLRVDGVALAGPREALDAGYLASLRQSGLRVAVLSVRSHQDATHFREAGASLLFSTRPTQLREGLDREGIGQHLLAYLPLDGDLQDRSPHKRHASFVNVKTPKADAPPVQRFAPGVFDRALDLKDRDAAVALGLRLPDRGSLLVWYQPRAWFNSQTVLDNSVDNDQWEVWIDRGGEITWRVDSKLGVVRHPLHRTAAVGAWTHLALVWDRRDETDRAMRLYVEGRLASHSPWGRGNWVEPGETLYLGGGHKGNDRGNGRWDDLAVFDLPLPESAVRELRTQGVGDLFNWRGKLRD
jgi:glycerophosphoryl diester phosphodiesterase